jgi:hypothetical protein
MNEFMYSNTSSSLFRVYKVAHTGRLRFIIAGTRLSAVWYSSMGENVNFGYEVIL